MEDAARDNDGHNDGFKCAFNNLCELFHCFSLHLACDLDFSIPVIEIFCHTNCFAVLMFRVLQFVGVYIFNLIKIITDLDSKLSCTIATRTNIHMYIDVCLFIYCEITCVTTALCYYGTNN